MQPLISVIIPTWNRASLLPHTVDSVLRQTWRPLELVVVDDGSPDRTAEVLKDIEPRVRQAGATPRFLSKANGGAASARNEGIRAAAGSWIGFLDDDDEWFPEKLVRQMARIGETGADACACLVERMGKDGPCGATPKAPGFLPEGMEPAKFLDFSTSMHVISLLVRAETLRDAGEFDETLRTGEDTEWMARLVHVARFCSVPEVLGRYNHSEVSLSRDGGGRKLLELDESRRRALALMKERNAARANWDEAAWRRRVARDYDQFVKHRLYLGDLAGARALHDEGMALSGGLDPLPNTRRKLRKARWLGLFGLRLKHPKLGRLNADPKQH